jgi:5-methylcytosine-specific restriction endonuclease McrA
VCPRCQRLITGRRCPQCNPAWKPRDGSSTSYAGGGGGGKWRRLRNTKIANDPICQWETPTAGVGRSPVCKRPAAFVDHIIPVAEAPDLRYSYTNLQSLCKTHNDEKNALDAQRGKTRLR